MANFVCRFCGVASAGAATEEEATVLARALGFMFVPVADREVPLLSKVFSLCGHCAAHVRSHVLTGCGARASDVLEAEDRAFEEDTDW